MSSQKTPATSPKAKPSDQALERRYGAIGISAVAAAVRYNDGRPADRQEGAEERPAPRDRAA